MPGIPKIREITEIIETAAPRAWQESWDNSGWQVCPVDPTQTECTGIVLTLDITENTLDQAIAAGANLILSHHPLLFKGLKQITAATPTERIVATAIKNGISIYSAHTNIDSAPGGVNFRLAQRLGLQDIQVLVPRTGDLVKLIFFTPSAYAERVRNALFATGSGTIGAYDQCSYNSNGIGTFRATAETCRPYVGTVGEPHHEAETRTEIIVPRHLLHQAISTLIKVHPYEEPAYDIIPLEQPNSSMGLGCVGNLPTAVPTADYLQQIATILRQPNLRHSPIATDTVQRVALCGGSGAEFTPAAIAAGAELYLTGDLKYHDFQRPEQRITLADGGHYETEVQVLDVFYDLISKKIPKFAVHCIRTNSNPVRYTTPNRSE